MIGDLFGSTDSTGCCTFLVSKGKQSITYRIHPCASQPRPKKTHPNVFLDFLASGPIEAKVISYQFPGGSPIFGSLWGQKVHGRAR